MRLHVSVRRPLSNVTLGREAPPLWISFDLFSSHVPSTGCYHRLVHAHIAQCDTALYDVRGEPIVTSRTSDAIHDRLL